LKVVGNNRFQKSANTILILNYLRSHGNCSRTLLSRNLGLQPSTVTYIVNRLQDLGLIYETVEAEKTGSGRKPILLALNREYGYTVGLDLQADYYHFVVTDLTGEIVLSSRRDYTGKSESFPRLVDAVIAEILEQTDGRILGLCLALPGIVDTGSSTVVDCWTHSLTDYRLPEEVTGKYDFPIILENDANCCSWNKLWDDGDESDDSFVYLLTRFHKPELVPVGMPPVGIGLGLVLEGEVFRGYRHMAGEFRSIFYREPGTGQLSISPDKLRSLPEDDAVCRELILELLRNILLLVPILNPRMIYIGGDLGSREKEVRDILDHEMRHENSFMTKMECRLEVLEDSRFDAARGAAVFSQKKLFSIPRVGDPQWNSAWYDYLMGKTGD